eukprot:CAMPEP_0170537962 /NCGR_PEP_ID=MMETSP0209-20121228/103030_1 /TAXON_ID=665100 ORGANISM="Litonotus pictus, Strain P1" /NCGR_SAMPLE_ID=MMETSP0209 /ASSEMBLY_ACC=CAM_ASM_000301 /LENGTH=90 /DNA_ID=CAMNT_0010839561 /DNA_START=1442 /DNA_END=1714 /DNA_ORIENTATION=-
MKRKCQKMKAVEQQFLHMFSLEYYTDSQRKNEISNFLLFDEIQNRLIENIDLPRFEEFYGDSFLQAKQKFMEYKKDEDANVNIKIEKMLI